MIYIIEGIRPESASIAIYELDHETPHCLYLKVHGNLVKKSKSAYGFRWFRSEEEVRTAYRAWVDGEIASLTRQLASLRALSEVSTEIVPPNARKHTDREIKL